MYKLNRLRHFESKQYSGDNYILIYFLQEIVFLALLHTYRMKHFVIIHSVSYTHLDVYKRQVPV